MNGLVHAHLTLFYVMQLLHLINISSAFFLPRWILPGRLVTISQLGTTPTWPRSLITLDLLSA